MKFFAFVAFFAFLAVAHAGIISPVVSAYSAPWVGAGLVGEQTVVAGPSGTIATGRTLAAPAVAAYGAPIVSSYAAPGLVARALW
ncbi:hypothetical protein NQ315_007054 [Exocentrus adspersus]|uniref:Uncharacterized protein n=1 Tax=Exocentrus adspersus TaxID=1586481 RepID=A0AAV8WDI7_9CUCU|nr:hypothetical protein NQ315_007054 [Exocentrus adspersus]